MNNRCKLSEMDRIQTYWLYSVHSKQEKIDSSKMPSSDTSMFYVLLCDDRADFRYQKAEISTCKRLGQLHARHDHLVCRSPFHLTVLMIQEASEAIVDDIRVDTRRSKFAIVNEKLQVGRTPDMYPVLSFGRGAKGWAIHDKRLISNHEQPMVSFESEGQVRQRKDNSVKLSTISVQDGRADLELFKQRPNGTQTPPSPPEQRRSKHIAKAESTRRQAVAGPTRLPSSGLNNIQMWQKSVYDVKDLPTYQAGSGSIPMRQTPTHSPTPTPSRRPSPAPPAVVVKAPIRPTIPVPAANININGSARPQVPIPAARYSAGLTRLPSVTGPIGSATQSSVSNGNGTDKATDDRAKPPTDPRPPHSKIPHMYGPH